MNELRNALFRKDTALGEENDEFIGIAHLCPKCDELGHPPRFYRRHFEDKGKQLSWDIDTVVWFPFENKWLCVLCGYKWDDDLKWVFDALDHSSNQQYQRRKRNHG